MGRIVGIGLGVFVAGIIANVVATASSTGNVGMDVRFGSEQLVSIKNSKPHIKNCLMLGLYSFSEQINFRDVIRVKERR